MKKGMIFSLLFFGFMGNSALAAENIQAKVLDFGLDTKFEGYTLDDVVKGKNDLNVLLLKHKKNHTFKVIGSLKDLNKYPKFEEHINQNNGVMCFESIPLDNNGKIVEFSGFIIGNTRDINDCTKFYKIYAEFLEKKVKKIIAEFRDDSFRSQGRDTVRKLYDTTNRS